MSKSNPTIDFDKIQTEAEIEDVTINAKDAEPIVLKAPDGLGLMRLAEAYRQGDEAAMLMAVCGDKYKAVEALLPRASHLALPALVEQLLDKFKLYQDFDFVGPGGGTVTERIPSKIKNLQRLGYKPLGE